jgi:hypothetical protein
MSFLCPFVKHCNKYLLTLCFMIVNELLITDRQVWGN